MPNVAFPNLHDSIGGIYTIRFANYMLNMIILSMSIIGYGQDSILNRLPAKFSKDYALISIVDLKYNIGLSDIDLTNIYENTFALIPLQIVYEAESNDLEQIISENTPTNDTDWIVKKKILLDTLSSILKNEKSIYLNNYNYSEVYELLNKYSLNDLFNKKRVVLIHKVADGNFEIIKYKDRRIGAWHYFKIKSMKGRFYLYYASKGSGSIYQACYDGRSTGLGMIIMFFQRIGWKNVNEN